MLSSQLRTESSTPLRDKINALEQQNSTLTNMYEELLLKYTQTYEECNQYQNNQSHIPSNSPDLMPMNNFDDLKQEHLNGNTAQEYNELYQKYQEQQLQICKYEKEKCEYISTIAQLKKDLSSAQRNILEMTNILGVRQSLPTVQEAMNQFYNIRDQSHHNTCSKLKKYLKIKFKREKYQKYYINQQIHAFMYKTLMRCNAEVIQYRKRMFDSLAQQLNMDYALKQIYYYASNDGIYDNEECDKSGEMKQEIDQEFIDSEKEKILGNRLGSYFRENYKYILKSESVTESVMSYVFGECTEFSDLQKENDEIMYFYREYVSQCVNICWVMLLQDPSVEITPLEWQPNGGRVFDDMCNKRVIGSDRKCKNILYFVWPNLKRNGNVLKNQKTEVVTQAQLFTPKKVKK